MTSGKVLFICALKIILFIGFFISSSADAKEQGHGVVSMRGEIIDSACGLDTASSDQTIDMLTQPVSEIVSEHFGLARPFSIKLVNCSLERYSNNNKPVDDWQYFSVTFDGKRDAESFGVSGNAQGVALQIRDKDGNVAIPGQALPAGEIEPGSMRIDYTLRLIGDGNELQAGAYHTTIRYKLDYY